MNILIAIIASMLSIGNTARDSKIKISQVMVVSGAPSGNAYFTTDHLGNAVLCWTAGENQNSFLYYSVYDKKSGAFGKNSIVTPSKATGMHGESMNKLAFKKDGTIVAVYERKHPTEKNKFAGSIFYTQSFDQGKTWTKEKFLHTDTVKEYGHSYFDVVTLADGEVGAVWLDGRNQNGNEGTALYFSKTKNRGGFQPDKQVGETVCQCCRTDLYVDQQGNLHLLYRDIESTIKGQVRDFVHIVSNDNGVTFSLAEKISEDNWIISGCPHTGASMCGNDQEIGVVWYTAGGTPGLYYTSSNLKENKFQSRQLISENARHPQLALWGNQSVVIWEEESKMTEQDHSEGSMHHESRGSIIFSILNNTNKVESKAIVDDNGGEFPVLIGVSSQETLVAYTKDHQVWVKKVSR
jgi:hypothetical protein